MFKNPEQIKYTLNLDHVVNEVKDMRPILTTIADKHGNTNPEQDNVVVKCLLGSSNQACDPQNQKPYIKPHTEMKRNSSCHACGNTGNWANGSECPQFHLRKKNKHCKALFNEKQNSDKSIIKKQKAEQDAMKLDSDNDES